jgi:hypothetical protein
MASKKTIYKHAPRVLSVYASRLLAIQLRIFGDARYTSPRGLITLKWLGNATR